MNDDILNATSGHVSYESFQGGSGYVPNNVELLNQKAPSLAEQVGSHNNEWSGAAKESEVESLLDVQGNPEGEKEEQDSSSDEVASSEIGSEGKDTASDSESSDDDTPLAARKEYLIKDFTCKECGYRTTDSEAFFEHQKEHEDFLQTCVVCDIQFKVEWEWLEHLRKIHANALWLGPGENHRKRTRGRLKKSSITKYVCSKCNIKVFSKTVMREHITNVHGKSAKVFTKIMSKRPVPCMKCDYKAPSQFHLKKHINLAHMNEVKPRHILCEMCGAKMQSRKTYENHLESQHQIYENGKPTEYLCDQCPYKVKSKGALYSHVRDKHRKGGVAEHKCPQCDFISTRKSNIKNHIFTKHTDETTVPKYKCPICDYETKYKNVIPTHIKKIHRKDEQPLHYCSLCDFSTIHPYNLKKHQLVHKDREEVKIYKCPHCKYETRHKHGVQTHMLVHTPAEQTTMYRCDLCNFQTKYKFGLQQHMRSSLHKNNIAKCGDPSNSLLDWAKAEEKPW